jgi:hypothetical protein
MNGQPVHVDMAVPRRPPADLDRLIAFMSGDFPTRKDTVMQLIGQARSLRNKEDVVRLGYEVILFRMELDEWVAFTERLLDHELGNQLDNAHSERAEEARERGSTRPSAELVKSQARQYTAPLKEAATLLRSTRDWMSNILSWCQSQQRLIANEEYGDSFTAANDAPAELYHVPERPPSVSTALRRLGPAASENSSHPAAGQ